MTRQFRARTDFYSSDFKSYYTKGLTYTIRDGNTKLAELAEKWAKDGAIELLDILVVSEVAGRGEVSGASPTGFWQKVKELLWP